jgi:hypothetical protein
MQEPQWATLEALSGISPVYLRRLLRWLALGISAGAIK